MQNLFNKIVLYIQQNKLIVFPITFLFILLIIVFLMVATLNTAKPTAIPTPIPTQIIESNTEVTPTTTTLENETIKTEAKPQIDKLVTVPYDIPKVKMYNEEWAIVEISNPSSDPANVVVKKENGVWKVMLGPGTYFDTDQLTAIGAPQSLIDEVNATL
jgi:hypothetical protein